MFETNLARTLKHQNWHDVPNLHIIYYVNVLMVTFWYFHIAHTNNNTIVNHFIQVGIIFFSPINILTIINTTNYMYKNSIYFIVFQWNKIRPHATVKANTKFTNHICLININVLKEIHIPCHPTYIISTNYILISNDMDKLGVTLLHNFWRPTNLNCCKIQGMGDFYSLNQIS